MSRFVVDASITLAWLFDDEDDSRAHIALTRLEEDGAVVPHLWHLETRNSLLTAERRRRLSSSEVGERLDALNELPIRTDEEADLQSAFDLAKMHRLSMYDALYLELAIREGVELATLDRPLGRAAAAEGVQVVA